MSTFVRGGTDPVVPVRLRVRRVLLTVFGLQVALAVALTLVDSYRRRGKRARPFETGPPSDVAIGEGTVTTYTFGADLYDAMLAAIGRARHRVLLETYIWKGDELGERFKQALYDAAARGVEVYAIYDGFANLVVSPRFKHFRPPIHVLRYPVYGAGIRFFDLRRYGRDHRKILVVDDEVAFVGGYNIGQAYATEWRDTHVAITGPAVRDLTRAFADFWNLHRRTHHGGPLLVEATSEWEPRIRVHRNIPRLWMFPIRAMYLEAINRATRNIYLTQAYFIPDPDFADSLLRAAQRGVQVKILVPETSNHVKTATIDGNWSTVGTANIDRLSMTGNYEVNVEFIDPAMAAQMERVFETDLRNAERLTLDVWESRPVQAKFTELFLAPLRPFL
jgi:cardiolipin synthase